ncbi:hypothetical protein Tco_0916745 [Tanacetum coccineum]
MWTKIELTLEQTQQGVSNEVLSDTKVFTMTMEIIPEPTSNKLCGRRPFGSNSNKGSSLKQRTYVIPETTYAIPPNTTTTTTLIIPTTLPFQSPFISSPPKTTPQTEGEQVRDKGKKALAHEEMVEEESESNSDAEIRLSGIKHVVKADAVKSELKKGKHDLIDLLGLDMVKRWTGITGKGPISLKGEIVGSEVDLNIKYPKSSLAEDSSASVLQALRQSSSIFTSVYVVVQKLKKALARDSV